MMMIALRLTFLLFLSLPMMAQSQSQSIPVEPGVSRTLADFRAEAISDILYQINLDLPVGKKADIPASETITFQLLKSNIPLQIDFKEAKDHLKKIVVNGKKVTIQYQKEHIIIKPEVLQQGKNEITIDFTAGNLSLNRNEDFLYTLLVPDRARTVFPCFDQPNLKARFQLNLELPQAWKALTNAPLQDSTTNGDRKAYHFQPSDTISTYLFSFAAGKFSQVSQSVHSREMHFYHRETDSTKIQESLPQIFKIHGDALSFLEEYTQMPYPFKKFDFVAIPDFQYGGMEHVGAIDYKSSALFLDEGATQNQKIGRSSLLSHETAHMWFGDLVTMQWFNDVWMKEVFANFMADKITQVAVPEANYDLKFLQSHFPAAYEIDRTGGANPIRQPLENLQEAGTLYGGIIYHKAPIVMRQLELLMGKDPFREGLREYLKQYAFSNATWPDLIAIMNQHTTADLNTWNEVWVNETGRPVFNYQLDTTDSQINQMTITQQGEDGSARVWPQLFDIALVYPDHTENLSIAANQAETVVSAIKGKPVPDYFVFNTAGQGYGLFPIDAAMLADLYNLTDTVTRAAVYINLYENMLNGRNVDPGQLLSIFQQGLVKEKEELNLQLITGYIDQIFWQFTLPEKRTQLAQVLEKNIWNAMQQNQNANQKKVLLKAYQDIAISQEAQDRLYNIWKNEQPPAGVKLSEDDYTSMALALALREYQSPDSLIAMQKQRIKNPDRRKRLDFLKAALSDDPATRDRFFNSLQEASNREKEAVVVSALQYLHHPLRSATSTQYLKKSLDLLAEIQQTGDIFFPQRWLGATFGRYQSPEAAEAVRSFLESHPAYNARLKAKILQSTDDLFRAEKILYEQK